MDQKKCIVHMPFYVNLSSPSGSQIRPLKIIDAFKNVGYEVDIIIGYGEERKKYINIIKKNIKKGIQYDFIYSESSTEPTLLTEKNHIPKYPLLDFSFLKFCKNNKIPIGLFYRDVYWRFPVYKENVSFLKRMLAVMMYKYDLIKYNQILDVFYLPSNIMYDYIPFEFNGKIEELPPAVDEKSSLYSKVDLGKDENLLRIFYVGGLNSLYNLQKLFEAVYKVDNIYLTVCCRKEDWNNFNYQYKSYLNDRISIVHKSGKELVPYFNESDICSLFFEPIEYRRFAMPVKLFEYITYKKPILANKGTATGEFVQKNDIGWNIEYSTDKLIDTLTYLKNNKNLLIEKRVNIEKIIEKNTWEARAKKVISDLTNL